MKTCSICKMEKTQDSFGVKGKNKDGTTRLEARCKPCKNQQNREKYDSNKEKINARRFELRNEDLEGYNAYQRERYWANREKKVNRMREIYHSSPEVRKKQTERVLKYRENNKEWWLAYQRKYLKIWREENREKTAAHSKVQSAKLSGKLVPFEVCEMCSQRATTEAHHEDYEKPLEVIWLCKPCHDQITNIKRKLTYANKRRKASTPD